MVGLASPAYPSAHNRSAQDPSPITSARSKSNPFRGSPENSLRARQEPLAGPSQLGGETCASGASSPPPCPWAHSTHSADPSNRPSPPRRAVCPSGGASTRVCPGGGCAALAVCAVVRREKRVCLAAVCPAAVCPSVPCRSVGPVAGLPSFASAQFRVRPVSGLPSFGSAQWRVCPVARPARVHARQAVHASLGHSAWWPHVPCCSNDPMAQALPRCQSANSVWPGPRTPATFGARLNGNRRRPRRKRERARGKR